jgi:hypothetical protein
MKIIRKIVPIPPEPVFPEIVNLIREYEQYSSHSQQGGPSDHNVCLRKGWWSWAYFHIRATKYKDYSYGETPLWPNYPQVLTYEIKCYEHDLEHVIRFADYVEAATRSKITIVFENKSAWSRVMDGYNPYRPL